MWHLQKDKLYVFQVERGQVGNHRTKQRYGQYIYLRKKNTERRQTQQVYHLGTVCRK